MPSKIIQDLEAISKDDAVAYAVGDTIRVHQLIREGKKERVQRYEGVVISRRNKGNIKEVVTVRKIVDKIGVEKTFLVRSPLVSKIEVVRQSSVRRAKLFYLRDRKGTKATRLKAKNETGQSSS